MTHMKRSVFGASAVAAVVLAGATIKLVGQAARLGAKK